VAGDEADPSKCGTYSTVQYSRTVRVVIGVLTIIVFNLHRSYYCLNLIMIRNLKFKYK
jgi:hypothetical protein